MEYRRILANVIEKQLFRGKVVLLYGPRRVGKTYLSKQLLAQYPRSKYINCELLQYQSVLSTTNTELLKDFLGDLALVVLDEAQHIPNIGLLLKVLVDTFPDLQIIATGSSSFDLQDKLSEPLTGRSRQYLLLPLAFEEMNQGLDTPSLLAKIDSLLRFGCYPEVFNQSEEEAREEISNIASNYLYKDVLKFEQVRKPDLVLHLLRALALQLGSEVSFNELAGILGQNAQTIKRYVELLEKNFVLFVLKSYSTNQRKEIAKGMKVYFYDVGIVNALLNNFTSPQMRTDKGALWENFCIAERIKFNQNHRRFVNSYFLRTYNQNEVDYIEEYDGQLHLFEFKYSPTSKARLSTEIRSSYPTATWQVIHRENVFLFLK